MNDNLRIGTWRYGRVMYYANDIYIGRSIELYGEYSQAELDLWSQIVRPGMTVMDVGANIGTHMLYLAQAVGPTGRVFAIEPQRQLYQMLIGNLALNEIGNVDALFGAVGDRDGSIEVPLLDYRKIGNFGGISIDDGPWSVTDKVRIWTIDSMELKTLHFIKIDVEGMECAAVRGTLDTIARCQPVLYVENTREEHAHDLIEMILNLGYRLYWHRPPLFNARNFRGVAENVFGKVVSGNMLGVPKHGAKVEGLSQVTGPDDRGGLQFD
jgi:FkbM family methyltransferase